MKTRISKSTAELIPLPPTEWTVKSIEWLISQETFQKYYKSIPVNENLKKSIAEYGILSPFLVMPNWYPIVGSQRLRACAELPRGHVVLSQEVRVARFEKEYWTHFHLWGDKEFVSKAIQVYFQTIELAWKSLHYIHGVDPSGKAMDDFEKEGNELKWLHRDGEVSKNNS